MSKKSVNINIKNLIQSHLDEAKKVKKDNTKLDEAFQTHTEELRNKIRNVGNQFNDI